MISLHEEEKEQLISQINQMTSELEELREQTQQVTTINHMALMQQNISSQEDLMDEINNKEEQII